MKVDIDTACKLLKKGDVVAIPTETVYGLAASLKMEEAIAKIFTLKNRPPKNPLIVHVANLDQIEPYILEKPNGFDLLAKSFWPGPLTIVLPIKTDLIPDIVRSGLKTCAFRIPDHPSTLEIIENVGPLVMPSANLSGRPSSTNCKHIEKDFGNNFPVFDGGTCRKGLESTIMIYTSNGWEIIRQGALTKEDFEPILGYLPKIAISNSKKPLCPGQLFRHYAPKAKLILDSDVDPQKIGVIVGFSDREYPKNCQVFALGPKNDPETVAKNLYFTFRTLDDENITSAWVDTDFPDLGLWKTIRERLEKAKCL